MRNVTSREATRYRARQSGTTANISIATQATTVHLGSAYQGKLAGKTVIVFDDSTTQGMSLEWARLLLMAGGARRIVMLTVSKYGTTRTSFDLRGGVRFDPFARNAGLMPADFSWTPYDVSISYGASAHFRHALSSFIAESLAG